MDTTTRFPLTLSWEGPPGAHEGSKVSCMNLGIQRGTLTRPGQVGGVVGGEDFLGGADMQGKVGS